ncbi:nucleotidyltransferase domain-containing protein [Pleionea sp. CnH1-48]|uniref:nucleotidyltransferase domain-containing protein n=1 Tax=Pleionea sp. CnH1-48 TaxID=2954494 RepID=UPI002097E269|nr:nucleotidyltransferase domain-containing protein [Pleionea sp. CnH1-48]MCO7223488.1 nucleotidyltransferase domain-containing protein [Pleionea sp. CnH1-48]
MTIEKDIQQHLTQLEQQKSIQILVAIESGSRAWGFPSHDSDYDVRIIYYKDASHYLSVFEQKDTLEVPITDLLDIAGWDLKKALNLMYSGNAVIHEWLNSPIIYREEKTKSSRLKAFAESVFNPVPAFYHYLNMSAKKFDVSQESSFSAKRLLYAYRTLLCALWIEKYQTAPPMLFGELMDDLLKKYGDVQQELEKIITVKAEGKEKDMISVNDDLQTYARQQLVRLKEINIGKNSKKQPILFDELFRQLLSSN